MRYLDRAKVESPACLVSYSYKTHGWNDFGPECKKATRMQLVEMQGIPGVSNAEGAKEHGVLCAYCEGPIYVHGHIEHFRRKGSAHYPELMFEWTNLFLACGSSKHCGHFKDGRWNSPYSPEELIKPDTDDPANFLYFSSTGLVGPRRGLGNGEASRAHETIRVFNLNESGLAYKRKKAAQKYLDMVAGLEVELADFLEEPTTIVDELRQELFSSELEKVKHESYSSVIRDLLS